MSDIELAVKRCKRLETLLEHDFAAAGRGLHEKISSIEGELPEPLVKRLRFIATVRNQLVHEADQNNFENRADYVRACDLAEKELQRLAKRSTGAVRSWATSTGMVVALLIAVLLLLGALVCGGVVAMSGEVQVPIHSMILPSLLDSV